MDVSEGVVGRPTSAGRLAPDARESQSAERESIVVMAGRSESGRVAGPPVSAPSARPLRERCRGKHQGRHRSDRKPCHPSMGHSPRTLPGPEANKWLCALWHSDLDIREREAFPLKAEEVRHLDDEGTAHEFPTIGGAKVVVNQVERSLKGRYLRVKRMLELICQRPDTGSTLSRSLRGNGPGPIEQSQPVLAQNLADPRRAVAPRHHRLGQIGVARCVEVADEWLASRACPIPCQHDPPRPA